MSKTITLEKLLQNLFNIQPGISNSIVNSAQQLSELLPDELLEKMPALRNPHDKNIKSQISKILKGEAIRSYADCAEYLLADGKLVAVFNHVFSQWSDSIRVHGLRDMLNKDENRNEISPELLTRLDGALACRDFEILKRALTVLTLLAITRDTGSSRQPLNRWKNLSAKIVVQNLLPRIENEQGFSKNAKHVIEICKAAYEMYDDDAEQFKNELDKAKKTLAQFARTAEATEKGAVFEALARIFFERFNGFFPLKNRKFLNEHVAELYAEKILPVSSLAKESLDKLAPLNPQIQEIGDDIPEIWHKLSAQLRLATVFNFLQSAQDCFAVSDPERWQKISEYYLACLQEVCRNGKEMFLDEFKTRAVESPADKNRGTAPRFFDLPRIFKRQMTREILAAA